MRWIQLQQYCLLRNNNPVSRPLTISQHAQNYTVSTRLVLRHLLYPSLWTTVNNNARVAAYPCYAMTIIIIYKIIAVLCITMPIYTPAMYILPMVSTRPFLVRQRPSVIMHMDNNNFENAAYCCEALLCCHLASLVNPLSSHLGGTPGSLCQFSPIFVFVMPSEQTNAVHMVRCQSLSLFVDDQPRFGEGTLGCCT